MMACDMMTLCYHIRQYPRTMLLLPGCSPAFMRLQPVTPTVAAWSKCVWLQALSKEAMLGRTAPPPFVPRLRFSNPTPDPDPDPDPDPNPDPNPNPSPNPDPDPRPQTQIHT